MIENVVMKEVNRLRKKLTPGQELEVWGKVYMDNSIPMRDSGVDIQSPVVVKKFYKLLLLEMREEVKKNALKSWRRYFPFKTRN